ncbi:MAG TPA: phosphoribosyltransferase [Candidatus Saccharimonadales bacterium]|nr:phosphoribosyltransferase [Candidatus Saccharimonadales bacterium]
MKEAPDLTAASYRSIGERMRVQHPELPSAHYSFTAETNPYDIMFQCGRDNSLARQLATVRSALKGEPDIYFFTANSAIPTADAIRAYYRVNDIRTPLLASVMANRTTSIPYFRETRVDEQIDSETTRLKPLIAGADKVAVIDQYVASGKTITYASRLLLAAGAGHVIGIIGNWYDHARIVQSDIEQLTSSHRDFMFRIGQDCATDNNHTLAREEQRRTPYPAIRPLRAAF